MSERKTGRPRKYPLREMAVGDTVFIPGATQLKINKVRSIYAPMKFKCRTLMRSGVIGCRVWRIA